MEETLTKYIQQIFNNWTALKLAVEHSMGGPNSTQTALDCMNYMVQYCLYQPNIGVEDIQEALEDILDEEFETICEDDSPREIATILHKYVLLLKEGNIEQCEEEYKTLPILNSEWLNMSKSNPVQQRVMEESSSEDEPDNSGSPMEDDGWVEVKGRKKR